MKTGTMVLKQGKQDGYRAQVPQHPIDSYRYTLTQIIKEKNQYIFKEFPREKKEFYKLTNIALNRLYAIFQIFFRF